MKNKLSALSSLTRYWPLETKVNSWPNGSPVVFDFYSREINTFFHQKFIASYHLKIIVLLKKNLKMRSIAHLSSDKVLSTRNIKFSRKASMMMSPSASTILRTIWTIFPLSNCCCFIFFFSYFFSNSPFFSPFQ